MNFTLEKWDIRYAENVSKYANNEKIAANLRDSFPYPYTLEDARGFIQFCIDSDSSSMLYYAIVIDGAAVGSIALTGGTDVYRKSAELGYWLAEPYWSQGIMTEAIARICAEGFEKMDIVRIFAEPYHINLASRRVLEKNGFALEGVLKNSVIKHDKLLDTCIYALLK